MDITTIMENDLSLIEADLGSQSFTWDQQDYLVSPSVALKSQQLERGGFGDTLDLILTVRISQFSDGVLPEAEDTLTFNNILYRIRQVSTDPFTKTLSLNCYCPNEGIK